MRELTKEEIEVLQRHAKWLKNEEGGEKANLWGANLRGATGKILSFGPIGSRQGITYVTKTERTVHVRCGCFYGTLEEFAAKVEKEHGDSQHGKSYKAAIEFIKAHDAACWQDDVEE